MSDAASLAADEAPVVRRGPAAAPLLVALAALLLAVAGPALLQAGLDRLGVRAIAAIGLLLGLAGRPLHRRVPRLEGSSGLPIALALLCALATGSRAPLLWVPAAAWWLLARVFWCSLAREDSLVERVVRLRIPVAPEFIRPYCRELTRLWALFFGMCAALLAGVALAGDAALFAAVAGRVLPAVVAALSVVEFAVRKWWFRYYFSGGPLDRLFAFWFPAERTAMGRRSLAYIERVRGELAAGALRES